MKTPNIIYLQACGDCDFHECLPEQCAECDFNALGDVTWSEDRINKTDKVYFSEDAVKDAVIDMLNFANIDNYDDAMEYIMRRLKGEKQ